MIPAPEFPGGHTWFNVSEPLSLSDLRGKVVLLDFWTSGCINCQHIIPDLMRLEEEFAGELVIIGVHSGKYDREQEDASVRQSILRFGLQHAVVNDPDFVIWSTYGVNAWPTLVIIDPAGNVVGGRSGEGIYPVFQPAVAALVEEFDARGEIDRSPIAIDLEAAAVTSAFLSYPAAVLADEAGDRLFIADSGRNRILIAGLDGELRGVIGSGQEGFDDGSFEDATLRQPQGLVLSADGNTLYIADTRNHAIRAADLRTSLVTTIAGTGLRALTFPQDGAPAVETDLASPWGLLLHDGTLYIAMAGTHQIWTIDIEANTISVFAG
ncbi:MAG: thioredoxin-like domain-containing protein, partial [Dehalococcoidia bacterium]